MDGDEATDLTFASIDELLNELGKLDAETLDHCPVRACGLCIRSDAASRTRTLDHRHSR